MRKTLESLGEGRNELWLWQSLSKVTRLAGTLPLTSRMSQQSQQGGVGIFENDTTCNQYEIVNTKNRTAILAKALVLSLPSTN